MGRAKELVMTCEAVGAVAAAAIGRVNRVVPRERLTGCADGEDTAEAITAFREKRPGCSRDR